jgi:hypothetical protein
VFQSSVFSLSLSRKSQQVARTAGGGLYIPLSILTTVLRTPSFLFPTLSIHLAENNVRN